MLERDYNDVVRERDALLSRCTALEKTNTDQKVEHDSLLERSEKLEKNHNDVVLERDALSSRCTALEKTNGHIQDQLDSLIECSEGFRENYDNAVLKRDELSSRCTALEKVNARLQDRYHSLVKPDEILGKDNNVVRERWDALTKKNAGLQNQYDSLVMSNEALRKGFGNLMREKDALSTQCATLQKIIEESKGRSNTQCLRFLRLLIPDLQVPWSLQALDLQRQLHSAEGHLKSTQNDFWDLQSKFQALSKTHGEVNDAKKAIDENSKKQSEAITIHEKEHSELLEKFTVQGRELDEISQSLKKAQEDASSKEKHITEQNQVLSKLEGDLEMLKINQSKMEDKIKNQQLDVSKKNSEIKSTGKRVNELDNEISKLTEKLSQAQKPCEVHEKEISDLARDLAAATDAKTTAEEQLEDLMESYDKLQCEARPSIDDQERLKKNLEELGAEHGLLLKEAYKLADGLLVDPGADHCTTAANLKSTYFSLRKKPNKESSRPSAPDQNVIMEKFLGEDVGHNAGFAEGNSAGTDVGDIAGKDAKADDSSSTISVKLFGRSAARYMGAFGKGNKGRRRRNVPLRPTLRDQLKPVAPNMVKSPVDGTIRADAVRQDEPMKDSATQSELEDWHDAHEGNGTTDTVGPGTRNEPAKNQYSDSATQTQLVSQQDDVDASAQGHRKIDTAIQPEPAKRPYADSATQTDLVSTEENRTTDTAIQPESTRRPYADSATQTDLISAQGNEMTDTATQTETTKRPYADSATQTESLAPETKTNASADSRRGSGSMFLLLILLAFLVAFLFTFWYCRHLSQLRLEEALSRGGETTRRILASLRVGGGSGTAVPSWLWDDELIEVIPGKAWPNLCNGP